MSNVPNLPADLQSLLRAQQYAAMLNTPQGQLPAISHNMGYYDAGLLQQQAAATWMPNAQQQQERITELAMQELQKFFRQSLVPPDSSLAPYQVYPTGHGQQMRGYEGVYQSAGSVRYTVGMPSAEPPPAIGWMESMEQASWGVQETCVQPVQDLQWGGQMGDGSQHRALQMSEQQEYLMQMSQGCKYGVNMSSEVPWNGQSSNWSGYQRGFRGRGNPQEGAKRQYGPNAGSQEGKRWSRLKPARGLLDNFEGDGPACIKLLNEYGQKNSCTVQYDSPIIPIKSDVEEKDNPSSCSVTVLVVDSSGQTIVQGRAEGTTKKLAKQGAAAQAVSVLFPQVQSLLKSKGLLEDVVKPIGASSGAGTGEGDRLEQEEQEGGSSAKSAMVINPVLHLQHACCRLHKTLEFNMREEGPPHCKVFHVDVVINGEVAGRGSAPKKKGAQVLAAREALNKLEQEGWTSLQPPQAEEAEQGIKRKRQEAGENTQEGKRRNCLPGEEGKPSDANQPTKLLHAHCSKNRLKLEYKVLEAGPAHARVFTVEAVIEDEVCGYGVSGKKKTATALAAQQVIERMGIDATSLFQGGKGPGLSKARQEEEEEVKEVLERMVRQLENTPELAGEEGGQGDLTD